MASQSHQHIVVMVWKKKRKKNKKKKTQHNTFLPKIHSTWYQLYTLQRKAGSWPKKQ